MEDLIRRLLGPEIRLEFSLDPSLSTISADSQQIGQVMMNLVVNARDAMPNGGTLTIETENVELGPDNVDVIPGPHVELIVGDSGLGMTADVRDRLFEPFFTTKDSGQRHRPRACRWSRRSSGKAAATSLSTAIPARARASRSTFRARATSPMRRCRRWCAPSLATVRGEGVILLAEDDRSVRRLVVTELTRRGFTVLEAEDGLAALEMFRLEKDRIDVLVTDVVMPRMNGADLARQAERIRPGVKILFISGHPERAGAGLDPTGVTNLLMKPFTADTLAARIKELVTGRKEVDGWS